MELRIIQSEKLAALGQMIAGVAHELNNPLSAINGFSELLLSTAPDDNVKSMADKISKSAERASSIVQDLLVFSRAPKLEKAPVNIKGMIYEVVDLVSEALNASKIDVSVDVSDDFVVSLDKSQMERVLLNLVTNSIQAIRDSGKGDRILLKSYKEDNRVFIEVFDNGPGISGNAIQKIFEPFFSTKDLGKGTGLGLSTVYGIIKQSGGFIYPDSVVGKGTTFRIFLPRYVATEGEVITKGPKDTPVRDLTGHERILIVEDEDTVRTFSARALRTTGYEVFEADSGEQALEVLQDVDGKIDLMISDVVMPEMDGPALLVKVREKLPHLKVIFVSGYAEESVRQDIADDQSVEFLPKPYSLDQINTKVKEVLSARAET